LPHDPQLALSVFKFAPPVQVDQALKLPSLLHVRVSVPLLQLPHDWLSVPVHVHAPLVQLEPEMHAWPHVPQFAVSLCSLTQVLPQSEYPDLQTHEPHVHDVLHVCDPLTSQTWVDEAAHAPAGCAQDDHADHVPSGLQVRVSVPQLPHDCDVCEPSHAHLPSTHAPVHVVLQSPQWVGSLERFTHEPEHSVVPLSQVSVHRPPAQATSPFATGEQAVLQPPQWFVSVSVSVQEEPQIVPAHVLPHIADPEDVSQMPSTPEHACPHDPQWSAVSSAVSQPSLGSPLQSPKPVAQELEESTHAPALQVT
jgi:hypothetical protein